MSQPVITPPGYGRTRSARYALDSWCFLVASDARIWWICVAREIGAYPGRVLDLDQVDLEEITIALADQDHFEHRWLIDPRSGEIVFWTADTRHRRASSGGPRGA